MKRILIFTMLVVLGFGACACNAREREEEPAPAGTPEVTIRVAFRNEVREADAWILPNTEENRGLGIWGTATVAKAAPGREYTAEVTKSDAGEYVLHMIDTGGMYYGSGVIPLADGYTVTVSEEGFEILLEIADAAGGIVFKEYIFSAAL